MFSLLLDPLFHLLQWKQTPTLFSSCHRRFTSSSSSPVPAALLFVSHHQFKAGDRLDNRDSRGPSLGHRAWAYNNKTIVKSTQKYDVISTMMGKEMKLVKCHALVGGSGLDRLQLAKREFLISFFCCAFFHLCCWFAECVRQGGGLLTLYLHSGWHESTRSHTKRFCLEQSPSIVDREGTASTHME